MDFTTDIMVQDQRRKKWGGTVLQYREYDTEILNRIKDVEKQILCKYIEICEKYHLRYFVAFGTLLGTTMRDSFRLHRKNAGKSIFFRLWIRIRNIICILQNYA